MLVSGSDGTEGGGDASLIVIINIDCFQINGHVPQEILHLIKPHVLSFNACWLQLIKLDSREDVLCSHVILNKMCLHVTGNFAAVANP